MVVNSHHTVISHLDIFARVGRGVAHDEIIPFKIKNGQLIINEESSDFDGTLVVEFAKVFLKIRYYQRKCSFFV